MNSCATSELNLRTQHLDLALQQLLMACSRCPPNPAPAWERLPPAAVRDIVLLWKIRLGSKCLYELLPARQPSPQPGALRCSTFGARTAACDLNWVPVLQVLTTTTNWRPAHPRPPDHGKAPCAAPRNTDNEEQPGGDDSETHPGVARTPGSSSTSRLHGTHGR